MSANQPSTPPLSRHANSVKEPIRRESTSSIGSNSSTETVMNENAKQTFYKAHQKTPSSYTKMYQHQLFTPDTPNTTYGINYKKALLSPTNSGRRTCSMPSGMPSALSSQIKTNKQQKQLQTPRQTPRCASSNGSVKRRMENALQFKISQSGKLGPLSPTKIDSGEMDTDPYGSLLGLGKVEEEEGMPKLVVSKRRKRSVKVNREEELIDYSSDDETPAEGLRKVSKRLRFDDTQRAEESKSEPVTPPGQITTKDYAYKKYIEERSGLSETECDDFWKSNDEPLKNPFVGHFKRERRPVPKEYARFENEMELVNTRTGKHIIRPLDKYQREIKPKRLFLEELSGFEDTPATPQNNVEPTIPKLHPFFNDVEMEDEEEEEEDEPIKNEPIFNPFKGHKNRSIGGRISKKTKNNQRRKVEIEYINHSTGERVIRKMTSEEMAIKPKKLNFDNC